ncbi:uncharacterized protein LOC115627201 [Scaptodrosophila lebanonensis]|uniref:acylphosphatase n=1 Tax=Drosophila lebanonensis TaxID=7225 RepID=A0A6J2TRK8_DROLE|nr:uncharacterized protein LOC115627201 [Scaptodrosophila lebanonensis]
MNKPVEKEQKDTEKRLVSCDFEIRGKIPKDKFEPFASSQALILGVFGYIERVSDECLRGQLQGEEKLIEAFRKLIETAMEYVAAIKEFIIINIKAIEECTYQTFEVRDSTCKKPNADKK